MDLTGIPTPPMDWDSQNLLEALKKFRQHVELIFAGPLEEKVKATYLLLWVGERGREIYNTMQLTEEQKASTEAIADEFQRHVQPESNPVFSRNKFKNEKQGSNSIDAFITKLKTLALDCAFGETYKEDMIRDQIVFGITSEKIREKLITEGDKLTLEKAVRICQSYEYAQQHVKTMKSESTVDTVKSNRSTGAGRFNASGRSESKTFGTNPPRRRHQRLKDPKTPTNKTGCGNKHRDKAECPAKGKVSFLSQMEPLFKSV